MITVDVYDPRALRPTKPRFGPTMGPVGVADPTCGTVGPFHFPPREDIPLGSARNVSAAQAASAALPPLHTAVVAEPNAQTGATGYPAEAPAIALLLCSPS